MHRYRFGTKSDALYTEINYCLGLFAAPLLESVKAVDEMIGSTQDQKALEVLFENMVLLVKVFYSFSFLDLPAFFEDHLAEFMGIFRKYLEYSSPIMQSSVGFPP